MSFVNIKPATILCGYCRHCRPLQQIGETLYILGLLSTRWSHPKAVDWWERLMLATLWIRVPIKCPAVKSRSNGVQFCEWGSWEFEVTCVSYWMEGETIWTLVDVHRVVSAIEGYRFNCKPIKLSCSMHFIYPNGATLLYTPDWVAPWIIYYLHGLETRYITHWN